MNVTFDKITALASAGFTKQEIAQMLGNNEQKQPAQDKKKQWTEQTKQENDFSALLKEMSDRMAKLEERLNAQPQAEQKSKTGETDDKVLALLQSINASSQKYDLPPKYNVEDALAKHYTAIMNGDNTESEDKK